MITSDIRAKYTTTIGIECHVQLKTKTKLFSGADNDARGKKPNTTVSPLCFGLPGTLPVLNAEAVTLAIRAGLALNAEIAPLSRFERKHYFYPDLPLGYQITQLAEPIILQGSVHFALPDGTEKTVRIHHAHLEADAGKLTHPAGKDYSLVDLNRAGTPLIEIVSEPDMHSPAEAKAYAQELYLLMTYADVTDGDLYHGNMRFDINVSVSTTDELGTRTETKNLNSFKSVERAAEYEVNRQIEQLEKGEAIVQETRGWDEAKQKTFSQRSKENAHDYRYFPDADLPPVRIDESRIESAKAVMPALPDHYRHAWRELELDSTVVMALLSSRGTSALVQRLYETAGASAARRTALWFAMSASEDIDADASTDTVDSTVAPDEYFVELTSMVDAGEINSTAAKEIFVAMLHGTESPRRIAEQKNLLQMSDESAIEAIVDEIMNDPANKQSIDDLRAGNERAIGFLVGQIMKKSSGKANPGLAQKLIRQKL
ncbi:MAG: Asp-tRNA(Asn)/Glu-tRNA(Gln) amidotransferase subunit GatB [Candidatus Saccharimonadales bacterium]|jgi:aspartyl-tRNA(Asn)/glutamyl-tRNA(Gln) amidotransferase subunit B